MNTIKPNPTSWRIISSPTGYPVVEAKLHEYNISNPNKREDIILPYGLVEIGAKLHNS